MDPEGLAPHETHSQKPIVIYPQRHVHQEKVRHQEQQLICRFDPSRIRGFNRYPSSSFSYARPRYLTFRREYNRTIRREAWERSGHVMCRRELVPELVGVNGTSRPSLRDSNERRVWSIAVLRRGSTSDP